LNDQWPLSNLLFGSSGRGSGHDLVLESISRFGPQPFEDQTLQSFLCMRRVATLKRYRFLYRHVAIVACDHASYIPPKTQKSMQPTINEM
jgi:hypothetical protein